MIQTAINTAVASLAWMASAARGALGYVAGESNTRRKTPAPDRRSEDAILDASRRATAVENSRDLGRNFSVAAWAVRKHLTYVTRFRFQGATKDKGFNNAIEQYVAAKSRTCDISGRHTFARMVRLLEARAILDGDCGLAMIKGGWLQGIEGDRILNPPAARGNPRWTQGVRTDNAGAAVEYSIFRRGVGKFEYERRVSANFFRLHGYYDRFDQVRGISPLLSAIATLRDIYEELDFAHAASKVRQLFVMLLTRNGTDSAGTVTPNAETAGSEESTGYSVDFGRGPQLLDMDPGDKAEFLESQHPATQFMDFMEMGIAISLKALDIPMCFFDESWTNFYGSRGSVMQYGESCQDKQDNLRIGTLDPVTRWWLLWGMLDGDLLIPSGFDLDADLVADTCWEWIPAGSPWWDPAKEIAGDSAKVRCGFDSPIRICREHGTDVFRNIDETARVLEYARGKGVVLDYDPDPTLAAQANAEAAQAEADAAAAKETQPQ